MITWGVIAIWLVMCGVIAWLIYADDKTSESEQRYCLKCGEVSMWSQKRGCEHCRWIERQW